jgi:hypothetical protein
LAEGLISSQDARTLIGDLVPEAKIPFSLAEKRAFLQLPETERRRILQEQAQSAAEEYRSVDWKEWEAADTPLPAYNQGVED